MNDLRPGTFAVSSLEEQFGGIDIYLFDQLLRGRLIKGMRVLDAGCGGGRNLVYLLRCGFDVFAVDRDETLLDATRILARRHAPHLPPANFRLEPVERMSFPDAAFDFIISSAVLHFSPDEAAFDAMLGEMWRTLTCGGILFARLASTIGIADLLHRIQGRRYRLPDGTERFLVDEAFLLDREARLSGTLIDPLKTTVVQNQRAMTTWVMRKSETERQ